MATVFKALLAIAERLPRMARGIATGGGLSADPWLYVDDMVNLVNYANDVFIGGSLFIETGDCAGALLHVRDSIQASGRILGDQRWWTIPTPAVTPAAGDIYFVTTGLYGPAQLLLSLREALRAWGWLQVRESVGTGDGSTKEFAQTTAGEITHIYTINEDGDSITERFFWEANVAGTGVLFSTAPSSGTDIQALIRYSADELVILPPTQHTLDDELGDISIPFLGYYGAYATIRAALGAPGQDQDLAVKIMNYYAEQAEAVRSRYQGDGIKARERFLR